MTAAGAFAATGAALLQLAATLAQSTKGTFAGNAGPALAVVTGYCQAAVNAFRLLASDPGVSDPDKLAAMAAARQFEDALGTIATQFGTSGSVATLSSLTQGTVGSTGLVGLFPAAPPPVTITPAAQAAIASLQRDPLTFVRPATATVQTLMATAAGGVAFPT